MSDDGEDAKSPAKSGDDDGLEVPVRRRRGAQVDDGQTKRRGLLIVLPLVMASAAIAFLVLEGMKDQAIYSKGVDQLIAEKGKFLKRQVMADGTLVHGTLEKRESPCEYRFTITKGGVQMPVRFPQCVVPDTFRDVAGMDVGVTVEGEILADNSFLATKVLAKCPSKYEMGEKAKQGEKMPHMAMDPTGLTAPAGTPKTGY